ncbi:MAG: hypothetical protein GWN58_12185, partial [Anaerolineae bacterium]|nr:hypothetical protein [Anaerolineae bacterium]
MNKVPEYRAAASVQVVQEQPTVPGLGTEGAISGLPVDPVRSEVQVLRSRSLLYAVADS